MKVDHVLILAAGKGTRMGAIGKELPKVIWPIFEKTLLEIQVLYAKKIAPEAKIYINLFNYKEQIKNFISEYKKSFENVEIIIEEEVLDIGGAIHNLASLVAYDGNLLILNSDQFLYTEEKIISNALMHLDTFDSILFSYQVDPKDGYNALKYSENNILEGIILNSELFKANLNQQSITTYSGMSLINLSKLPEIKGESRFFESVANPIKNQVYVEELTDFEYWDFGTLKRYKDSMLQILKRATLKNSKFVEFLISSEVMAKELIMGMGYGHKNYIFMQTLKIYSDKIVFNVGDKLILENIE